MFTSYLEKYEIPATRQNLETLQINLGNLCNQACRHCHVEASPKGQDNMTTAIFERILELIDQGTTKPKTVDLTGGAPEMNPNFRWFVKELKRREIDVLDRCNLTVLYESDQEDLAEFLAYHEVKIVASLPCYSEDNVDKQRGNGVFEKSIRALRQFNQLGYAKNDRLTLDLVYNPLGPSLPPSQDKLEVDYKENLMEWFGISFNHLYTITNMPIKRFLEDLKRQKKYDEYMTTLINAFNPQAAKNMMCYSLISISHDGKIYDCDFNQMTNLPSAGRPDLWSIKSFNDMIDKQITWANHCFGCSAGAGSSCGGSLT
ncbi:MAG: radical SAM protein [Bdellovibrionales bacterium CG12_big_fil_rev_8_21_14_0_65_38_15]|nr:MAG: radical SAM protein [Bdellovibrionales bacterium CG22_combo_CG10-13_8_21_14_all_38_13]PIQ56746.1 MAG: radical SAM protein [Bdellovibrionales bacterium CG12_big_fil_rev_8_21_14_0_65_38_15]PIR31026.1 MAG: radical SAM protein [Bdellovibrionales bacterium CG11_big_fil_rev_8_21_14_0_20_38_13]